MDRNKKGLAWNVLISGIIALFVLGIIAYISLGPVLMGTLKGVFGMANQSVGEGGFVPYAQPKLNLCEQKVTDSINSLIFGINNVALNTMSNEDFGQTKVRCLGGKCTINNFELCQNVPNSGILDWSKRWITAAGDPHYLVYYESFPKGEEAYWQISESSFFIDVVFFGGVLNVIPYGGRMIRGAKHGIKSGIKAFQDKAFSVLKPGDEVSRALRTLGKNAFSGLSETALIELTEVSTKKGYQRLLKSELVFNNLLERLPKGSADEISELIRTMSIKRMNWYVRHGKDFTEPLYGGKLPYEQLYADLLKEPALKGLDPVSKNIIKNNLKILHDPIGDTLFKTLQRRNKVKQFFTKNFLTDSGTLNTEKIGQLFTKKVYKEVFEELGEESRQGLLKQTFALSDDLILESVTEGSVKSIRWTSLLGAKGLGSDVIDDFGKLADELMTPNADKLTKLLIGVSEADVNKFAGKPLSSTWNFAKKMSPIQLRFKGSLFNIPRPILYKSLGYTSLQAVKLPASAAHKLWRSRFSRYVLAYIIAGELAEADARNEKYKAKGKNNIILHIPFVKESEGVNLIYGLDDSVDRFYMNTEKEEGENNRMFFVSPCSADIEIESTTCSCQLNTGDYLMKSNRQPVDPASLDFDQDAVKTYYSYDAMSYREKEIAMIKAYTNPNIQSQDKNFAELGDYMTLAILRDPVIYNKFFDYVYERVYLPAMEFILTPAFGNKPIHEHMSDRWTEDSTWPTETLINLIHSYPAKDYAEKYKNRVGFLGACVMAGSTGGAGGKSQCNTQPKVGRVFRELLFEPYTQWVDKDGDGVRDFETSECITTGVNTEMPGYKDSCKCDYESNCYCSDDNICVNAGYDGRKIRTEPLSREDFQKEIELILPDSSIYNAYIDDDFFREISKKMHRLQQMIDDPNNEFWGGHTVAGEMPDTRRIDPTTIGNTVWSEEGGITWDAEALQNFIQTDGRSYDDICWGDDCENIPFQDFSDLITNESYLGLATRKAFFHYHEIDDSKVNDENMIKLCHTANLGTTSTTNILREGTKGHVSIDCINAKPNLHSTASTNYCFSGDHSWITIFKWASTGLAIVIDVGVAMTGVGLIVEAPVAVLTGAGAAYASKKLDEDEYWPNH
jgi:hypothetical protein